MLCVVDQAAVVRSYVSAANELETESKAALLSLSQMREDERLGALEVCLVCVVDDDATVSVELSHHLERSTGDPLLVVLRLSIDDDLDIAFLALSADLV